MASPFHIGLPFSNHHTTIHFRAPTMIPRQHRLADRLHAHGTHDQHDEPEPTPETTSDPSASASAPASPPLQANPQYQSPLFNKLPPELRIEIYRLVLTPYVAPDRKWARNTFYTRPGYDGLKRVDVALLRTCRRIHQETNGMEMRDFELVLYMGRRIRAPVGEDPSLIYRTNTREYKGVECWSFLPTACAEFGM